MNKFLLALSLILTSFYTHITFARPFASGPPCEDCVLKRYTYAGAQERKVIYNKIKHARELKEKRKITEKNSEEARKERETILNELLKKNKNVKKISTNSKTPKTCMHNASGKLICGKVCMKNFYGEVKCGNTCSKNIFGKITCK